MIKKILIAGASGTAGSTIAATLAESMEFKVYGLTHKKENRSLIENLSCFPVISDLTNLEQSMEVIERIQPEIIISSVRSSGEKAREQEYEMNKNLIQISKKVNISTFIYLSVFKSDENTEIPHFEVKADIENLLMSSGLNYVIMRPATFMDGLFMPWFLQSVKEKQTLVSAMELSTRISYIHTRDIAALISHAIRENLVNETHTIGGQVISIKEIQQILSRKMNAEIGYHQLDLEQVRQMAGDDIAMMVNYFNNNDFVVTENILPTGYMPHLRTFENEIDKYI